MSFSLVGCSCRCLQQVQISETEGLLGQHGLLVGSVRLGGSEALETAAETNDLGVHVIGQPVRSRRERLTEVSLLLSVVEDEVLALVLPQKPRCAPLIRVLNLGYQYLLV